MYVLLCNHLMLNLTSIQKLLPDSLCSWHQCMYLSIINFFLLDVLVVLLPLAGQPNGSFFGLDVGSSTWFHHYHATSVCRQVERVNRWTISSPSSIILLRCGNSGSIPFPNTLIKLRGRIYHCMCMERSHLTGHILHAAYCHHRWINDLMVLRIRRRTKRTAVMMVS